MNGLLPSTVPSCLTEKDSWGPLCSIEKTEQVLSMASQEAAIKGPPSPPEALATWIYGVDVVVWDQTRAALVY